MAALNCRDYRGVEVGDARRELTAPPFDSGRVDPKPTVVLAGDADSFLERAAGGRDAFAYGDAHPALGHERVGHTRCPIPSGYLADLDGNRQLPPRRERVLESRSVSSRGDAEQKRSG